MTVEANKDLLKRQRTFSIDETREQLRQGRPVQREAILSGKVDSRSLYYGDEPSGPAPSAQATKKEPAASAPAAPVTSPAAAKKSAPAAAPTASAEDKKKSSDEAHVAAADVVEHIASAAASMAMADGPAVVEAMSTATPQKITPSTWAAMLKSSATATAAETVGAKPAVQVAVKRTPAKTDASKTPTASSAAKTPKGEGKEKEGEGKRRKGSEGGAARGKSGEGKEAREGGRRRSGSNDAPGTPSRPVRACVDFIPELCLCDVAVFRVKTTCFSKRCPTRGCPHRRLSWGQNVFVLSDGTMTTVGYVRVVCGGANDDHASTILSTS
jgi:hypothetical protein